MHKHLYMCVHSNSIGKEFVATRVRRVSRERYEVWNWQFWKLHEVRSKVWHEKFSNLQTTYVMQRKRGVVSPCRTSSNIHSIVIFHPAHLPLTYRAFNYSQTQYFLYFVEVSPVFLLFESIICIADCLFSLSLSLYIYIYIYIYRQRGKERERNRQSAVYIIL